MKRTTEVIKRAICYMCIAAGAIFAASCNSSISFSDDDTFESLNDYESSDYPQGTDTWSFDDDTADYDDFEGLQDALASAYSDGRMITVVGNNLKRVNSNDESESGAFYNCKALEKIDLYVATRIKNYSFEDCINLKTADLSSVTVIEKYAFDNCVSLESLSLAIEDELVKIEEYAFNGVDTEQITLTTNLMNSVYINGTTLTLGTVSVTFKEINLVDVDTLDDGYNSLAEYSATNYPTIANTWIIDDVSADLEDFYGLRDALATAYDKGRSISLIAENLTSIPVADLFSDSAFYHCDALVSIKMPLITEIGDNVFRYCSYLETLNVPLVTSVGAYGLSDCRNLTTLIISPLTSVGEYGFYGCLGIETLDLTNTTTLGAYAFHGCTAFTDADIPLITELNPYTFYNCSAITTYDFSAITKIDEYALYGCSSLTSLDLPLLTSISRSGLYNCTGLATLEIPAVTTLGEYALYGCESLTDIYLPLCTDFGAYAIYACTSIKSVYLPLITVLNKYAMAACSSLESVTLALYDKFTSIDYMTFNGTEITETTLTVGSTNAEFISNLDRTLTVGYVSYNFSTILY